MMQVKPLDFFIPYREDFTSVPHDSRVSCGLARQCLYCTAVILLRRNMRRPGPSWEFHMNDGRGVSPAGAPEQDGYFVEDLEPGMSAVFAKTVTEADITLFAGVTGDMNPVHLNDEYAAATVFKQRVAHGMLSAGFISAVLGTRLPGPGCVYLSQSLKFKAPVWIGDTVQARATVKEVMRAKRRVVMETVCSVGETVVVAGEALLLVPSRA